MAVEETNNSRTNNDEFVFAHARCTNHGTCCRLVAAAENGSYHWLDDMYNRSDISTFNYTKWDVGNLSMRDVYLQHTHLKEDMIAS